MKTLLALLFAGFVSGLYAQGSYQTSQFSITIKGTSNLHDWESVTKEAKANAMLVIDGNELKSISSFLVDVPVKSIKSPKGSIMDNKTYDALKAKNYPNISYKLDKVTSIAKKGDGFEISASGYLSIAGATNKIDLLVKGKRGSDGSILLTGAKKLKMTDYKIDPPTALFGTLTTGDDIEVVFQVTLKQFNN